MAPGTRGTIEQAMNVVLMTAFAFGLMLSFAALILAKLG